MCPEVASSSPTQKNKASSSSICHPPLTERIQALDPSFKTTDYPQVTLSQRTPLTRDEQFSGLTASNESGEAATPVVDASRDATLAATISATVGSPQPRHVDFARQLRASIPSPLYEAAHSPELSLLLVVALSLETDAQRAGRQLQLVEEQMGDVRAEIVRKYHRNLSEAEPRLRLPLLEIAFPMLKHRPAPQLEFLLDLVRKITELDGQLSFGEYCFLRILTSQLRRSVRPAARPGNRVSRRRAREAAVKLIRIIADQGNREPEARAAAFRAGTTYFGKWAGEAPSSTQMEWTVTELDQCLDILQQINIAGRQSLLLAVIETVSHDGRLTVSEGELLRAVCAALELPLPPILGIGGRISRPQ